jgi:hypothetical protein
MHNRKPSKPIPAAGLPDIATSQGPRPGDFPVGSVKSRAAARTMLEGKKEETGTITICFIAPDGRETGREVLKIESP